MYDIAIVGAGPAGATLARLLGNSRKILIIEKRRLDCPVGIKSTVKCCGGLLAPDAQKIIAELGLGLPQDILVGPQLFTVRTIDMEHDRERYYQRFYINFDREKMDRWLVSLIPKTVDARFGCMFKGFEREKEGFKLRFSCNGKEYAEYSKVIVGADGANSMVRRQAFKQDSQPEKYISIQEWYETDEILPYFSSVFDRQITDFYSWTIPKDNRLILGSALLPGDDAGLKFELLKRKLGKYGFSFKKLVKREGAFILRPRRMSNSLPGRDGIALIGEAAGWISPSSAEGFSYAFRSALALAESIVREPENLIGAYRRNTIGLKGNILLKNLKVPFMYNPIIRNAVMASGLLCMNTPQKSPK